MPMPPATNKTGMCTTSCAVRRRRDAGGHGVEAVQHRGGDQIVRAQRLGHRNTLRGSEVCDPVGDPPVRQEPGGDHQTVGAVGRELGRGVGDARMRSGGESDLGACPARPGAQRTRHRRGPRVGGFARRAHRDDEHAETVVVRGHPDLGQPLPQHRQQRGILTENPGPRHRGPRLLDHRRDVGPGVVRVGQKERNHDAVAGHTDQYVAKVRRVLLEKRRPDVQPGPQPPDPAGHRVCHRRRARVGAAVGGQYQGHDACNPHSVFDRPAQRPLRGSAPSTGFAVHGAQPIDG